MIGDWLRQLEAELKLAHLEHGAPLSESYRQIESTLWQLRRQWGHSTMRPLHWIVAETPHEREQAMQRHETLEAIHIKLALQCLEFLKPVFEMALECTAKSPHPVIYRVSTGEVLRDGDPFAYPWEE
jgi:hypothetical protein